jgi:flagellar motor component MotA
MSNRQFALKSKVGELMTLLETIKAKGIESVDVRIDTNEIRTYTVGGLRDALSNLTTELISSTDSTIATLEERYEHDRADVFRIVGRLAETVASTSVDGEYATVTAHLSTF